MSDYKERQKEGSNAKGPNKALDNSYNEQSGGLKVVGPIVGQLTRLFVLDAVKSLAAPFKNGGVLAIYNPTANTAWLTVSTTAADPAAPSASEASSIALKPNDYTHLAMPENATKVRCDTATAVCYLVEDDSFIR